MTSLRAVPSIGVAYINAALTLAGHQVQIIDAVGEALLQYRVIEGSSWAMNGLTAKEIAGRIHPDTDFIGVSVMHANEWIYDKFIIKTLNQKFPNAKVFVGGETATGLCDQIMSDPEINVALAVLGEADETCTTAIKALAGEIPYESAPGIAFKKNGQTIKTKRNENIREVDALPFPRWEGFPLENYFSAMTGVSSHAERSMTMVATRGCPHACTFCTVPGMWNSKWNPRSPENVVDEMQENARKYGVTHIDFVDLTFATNKRWTERFCEVIQERNFKIRWSLPIGTRTESLTPELLKKMKDAGCQRILYSPESGSKITLQRINKKLKISDLNRAITGSLDAGIVIKLATIFGFPGQTKREVLQSLWFIFIAALRGVHDVVCLCFVPYPGTKLYDDLVSSGEVIPGVTPTRLNNDIKDMTSWSEHIPKWSVSYIAFFGMATFYGTQFLVRPLRFLKALYRIFIERQPVTNFESIIYCVFFRPTVHIDRAENVKPNLKVSFET